MVEPVRPISLADIEDARERISGTVLRTPLVKLDLGTGAADVYLKLENLQPTNAYKIRGAANAVARSVRGRACPGRVDRQRWKRGARRRLRGPRVRRSLHGGCDRDGPPDKAGPDARAWRCNRAGVLRHRLGRLRGSCVRRRGRDLRPSVRQSRFHRRPRDYGARDPRGPAGPAHRHRGHRRGRADHRRRKRHQGGSPGSARSSAPSRKPRRRWPIRSRKAARSAFPTGRRLSSTARAGRASRIACGSGCSRWSTARSPSRSTRRVRRCG